MNQHEKGSLLDYDSSVRPSTSAMSDYFTRLRAFSLSLKPIGLLPPISSTYTPPILTSNSSIFDYGYGRPVFGLRVTDKFYDGVHSLSSIQATTNLGPGAYDCSASGFFEGNARHGSLTPFHKSLPYPSYRYTVF